MLNCNTERSSWTPHLFISCLLSPPTLYHRNTHRRTTFCLNVIKLNLLSIFRTTSTDHPSITGIILDVCVVTKNLNPGRVYLEWLRPLKHLWEATEQQSSSPSGTNTPGFNALSPNQWNSSSLHTFQPNDGNWFPPPPSDRWTAYDWSYITPACLRDCLRRGRWVEEYAGVCLCLCVSYPSEQSLRLSLCTGWSTAMLMLIHSQWPQLKSQCCASWAATPLQLKVEGC